jgi:hypothetical protein
MNADEEELELLWDQFVRYCEDRNAQLEREQQRRRGR